MKFPYLFLEGQYLPIVPLKIKGRTGWTECRAFVDTGASYPLFPADVAEILGIIAEEGELTEMTVGDGNTLKVYLHRLLVSIAGKELEISVGFSKGLGVGFYILGRKGIFEKFLVTFNERDKWVGFEPLE